MGDRGTTHGTLNLDYNHQCKRCESDGVVISPLSNKRGRFCPECLLGLFEDMFALSEMHDILTTGEMYPDGYD